MRVDLLPDNSRNLRKMSFGLKVVNLRNFYYPPAETALVNFHRDEILSEDELPKKIL